MKKQAFIVFLIFSGISVFAQKKIGTIPSKNILFATAINEKPVYAYYEFNDNDVKQIYLNYKNNKFGPYNYIYDVYNFTENRIALITEKVDGRYAFINGKEYGPCPMIYAGDFISDTEYFYYTAISDDPDNDWLDTDFYINGTKYQNVRSITKSKKGLEAKCIYDKAQGEYFVEFNNQKFGPYSTEPYQIFFLSDEKTLIYTVNINQEYYFVLNGKAFGPYKQIGTVQISSDKKHYAYFYQNNWEYTLIKDGETIGTYSDLYIDYNFFPEMPYLRFMDNTDTLCYIEQIDPMNDTYALKAGKNTYKDINPESLRLKNNYAIYLKEGEYGYRSFDAYINENLVQKNIIHIYPFMNDKNDYAYLSAKKISLKQNPGFYYGSMDEDDEDIFYADCLFYKNNEYLLSGYLTYVALLNKKDLLYILKNQDDSYSFFLNEKETFKIQTSEFTDFYSIKLGDNYLYFELTSGEANIFYNGSVYPGSATDSQIVYVDKGNIFVKKLK